jgi:hypothetical protein
MYVHRRSSSGGTPSIEALGLSKDLANEVRDARFAADFEDEVDLVGNIDVGTSIELQEGVA